MVQNEIILASQSAARIELLRRAGLEFRSLPANIDERFFTQKMLQAGSAFEEIVKKLAREKARKIARENQNALVIGSDQILVFENEILPKAKDEKEAIERLKKLRGKTHRLICGVAVAKAETILWEETDEVLMTMHNFSDAALEAYAKSAKPALTACSGGYQIEGPGAWLFEKVEGDWATVMGLPLLKLLGYLQNYHDMVPR